MEITVRRGQTLSGLAQQYGTTWQHLAELNNISDPRRLQAGQSLQVPDQFDGGLNETTRRTTDGDGFVERRDAPPGVTSVTSNGRQYPASADGTPLFRQGDPEWGGRTLGRRWTIGQSGCAMTAAAMALSKISGRTMNPGELDRYLDRNGGYSGDALHWDVAARAFGLNAQRPAFSLDAINRQIDAGRPVVVGVDYKAGSRGGANGTDHWVTITGRERDAQGRSVYLANDPATGRQFRFREENGRLVSDYVNPRSGRPYQTTNTLVTFG